MTDLEMFLKEQAITFGAADSLAGVLTSVPTEVDADTQRPHVLILNAGVVHHVGPGRLGVEIAHRLAEAGFPSLRFDFSGIGDSAPRVPPLDPIACGIADVRDAMDYLGAHHGARRFILLGLCSGARHAYYVATADPRIVGAVMLDGYAFPTMRSKMMEMRSQFDQPMDLVAGVSRRLNRMFSAQPASQPTALPSPADDEGDAFFPKDPTRDEMARDLATLATRNVNLLCVFSGEWQTYRYEGQLREAFSEVKLGELLTERLIDTADHLYFTRPERTAMMMAVTSWLKERFH